MNNESKKVNKESHENDKMFFVRERTTKRTTSINLKVDEGYVSCDMCACCYSDKGELDPVWCQIFSKPVDPNDFEHNRSIARNCSSYVPKFMERSMVNTPNVECWYEKDSIA